MNKAEVLLLLKSNPEDLLSRVGIIVEQEMGDSLASLGGQREINFSKLKTTEETDEIYKFSLHSGIAECYYYPYITRFEDESIPGKILSVGHCLVPIDAPVGTIVFTGGMNGCALQINRTQDSKYLIFMHDFNSQSMNTPEQKTTLLTYMRNYNKGVVFSDDLNNYILRIDADSYSQELQRIFSGLNLSDFEYGALYPITVKTSANRWEIFMCPLKCKNLPGLKTYESIKNAHGNNSYLRYSFNI